MLRLLTQRLAGIIPMLFVISIFFFFMIKASPYDEVDAYLESQGLSFLENEVQANQMYNESYIKLGLDKPNFYFSIIPHYYPKNINFEPDPKLRSAIVIALKKGYVWEEISSCLETYKALLDSKKMKRFDSKLLPKKEAFLSRKTKVNLANIEAFNKYKLALSSLTKCNFPRPKLVIHGFDNQYHHFIKSKMRGDFGISRIDGLSVVEKIKDAFFWTCLLVLPTLFLSILLGFIFGFLQALNAEGSIEKASSFILNVLYIIPMFLLASLLLVFFTTKEYGVWTNIFPRIDIIISKDTLWKTMTDHIHLMILPGIILIVHFLAYLSAQLKNSMLEESEKPYYQAMFAKGLSKNQIYSNHLFKNSLLPLVTILTGMIPMVLSGTVVIEEIFNLPGIGRLFFRSIILMDWNVCFALAILISFITVLSFFLADLLYVWLNPKIKKTLLSK